MPQKYIGQQSTLHGLEMGIFYWQVHGTVGLFHWQVHGTVGLEMEGEGLLFPYILCYCWSFVTRREENANFRELFFLSYVYPMLPVSLDCSFLIAPSVFSNVYLHIYIIMGQPFLRLLINTSILSIINLFI